VTADQVAGRPSVDTSLKAAKPVATPPAKPAPGLSEKSLRKAGKISGFTGTRPAFQPPAGRPLESTAAVLRAGSASTLAALQPGGKLPTKPGEVEAAEQSVAFNPGHEAEWSMAAMKKDPKKFLRDVVQLDGSPRSTADQSACGPTALLMGMIAGRPQSIQELAGKLVDAQGRLTPAGEHFAARLPASAQDDLRESLGRLREGKALARPT